MNAKSKLMWFVAVVALTACVSPQRPAASPQAVRVWPDPPETARLSYVGSISTPSDAGMSVSSWQRLGAWLTGEGRAQVRLVTPFGVAVDETGNLCMTDTGAHAVCYFDFVHKRFRRWQRVGNLPFQSPVAVGKENGIFYVVDSGLAAMLAFSEDGHLDFAVTNQLERPSGLGLSRDKLFVTDSKLHRVLVFDLKGNLLFQFGRRGTAPGEFNFPTHVTVSERDEVYVTDSMNARVEVFDTDGRLLRVIGGPGDSAGHFNRPKGVAVDHWNHAYVVDAMFDNCQIFDSDGQLLLDVGSTGVKPGEFWLPSGIAISRDDLIYLADSSNHRVQILKFLGQP